MPNWMHPYVKYYSTELISWLSFIMRRGTSCFFSSVFLAASVAWASCFRCLFLLVDSEILQYLQVPHGSVGTTGYSQGYRNGLGETSFVGRWHCSLCMACDAAVFLSMLLSALLCGQKESQLILCRETI